MAEGSKTEKATPKKRRDERKKGNVFLSQDAVAVTTLLGSFAALWMLAGQIIREVSAFMVACLTACGGSLPVGDQVAELEHQGILLLVQTVLPLLLVTAVCAIVATFAQTRLLVTSELLRPKFSRINPLQGIKRLFSLKSVIDALKGIIKIILLLAIIYISLEDMVQESYKYLYTDLRAACAHLFDNAKGMVIRIAIAFIAVAALDFMYQWWDYERQLKMSKQEIKEEYKQTEGNPQIKGRIRSLQRQMAMSRMIQKVPQADVIIRNPTHYAIALKYDPNVNGAPMVLAKGQDELALRIIKVGEENGVFITENRPLARALYESCELDREIPAEYYGAVAELLVYVYRLNHRDDMLR